MSAIRAVYISTAGYIDPGTKNNLDLVTWAKNAYARGWGYVWGTYGEVLTRGAYKAKAEQYPNEVGGYAEFIQSHWVGGRTADCIGLIKGYGWFDPESGKIGYGVAGLMGNLYAESGLLPNNLQDSYERVLGYSDSSYTQAVDSGSYTNFPNDSAGYGLAQWTVSSRKRDLLAFANARGCSIANLDMQLDFLCEELERKLENERRENLVLLDRKLKRKIEEKKQAQGLRQ